MPQIASVRVLDTHTSISTFVASWRVIHTQVHADAAAPIIPPCTTATPTPNTTTTAAINKTIFFLCSLRTHVPMLLAVAMFHVMPMLCDSELRALATVTLPHVLKALGISKALDLHAASLLLRCLGYAHRQRQRRVTKPR